MDSLLDSSQQPSEAGATAPMVQLGKLRHRACSWLFLYGIIFLLGTQPGLGPLLAAGAWEKEAQRKQREPSLPPQAPALCPSCVLDPPLPGVTLSSVWLRRKPATAPNASPGGSHARAGVSFPSIFFQPLPVRARLGVGGGEGKMDGVG